jgi:hypothetical protein
MRPAAKASSPRPTGLCPGGAECTKRRRGGSGGTGESTQLKSEREFISREHEDART